MIEGKVTVTLSLWEPSPSKSFPYTCFLCVFLRHRKSLPCCPVTQMEWAAPGLQSTLNGHRRRFNTNTLIRSDGVLIAKASTGLLQLRGGSSICGLWVWSVWAWASCWFSLGSNWCMGGKCCFLMTVGQCKTNASSTRAHRVVFNEVSAWNLRASHKTLGEDCCGWGEVWNTGVSPQWISFIVVSPLTR